MIQPLLRPSRSSSRVESISTWNSKSILFLGESGGGKSSFLQLLLNYLDGKEFNYASYDEDVIQVDKERSQISPARAEEAAQTSSQTQSAVIYKVKVDEGTEFYLVDTPGLCDADGFQKDEEHLGKVYNALECLNNRGVKLCTIVFIYNGQASKFDALQYVKNFYCLLTPQALPWLMLATRQDVEKEHNSRETYILNNPLVLYFELKSLEMQKNRKQHAEKCALLRKQLSLNEGNFENILRNLMENFLYNGDLSAVLSSYRHWIDLKQTVGRFVDEYDSLNKLYVMYADMIDAVGKESEHAEDRLASIFSPQKREGIVTRTVAAGSEAQYWEICDVCFTQKSVRVNQHDRLHAQPAFAHPFSNHLSLQIQRFGSFESSPNCTCDGGALFVKQSPTGKEILKLAEKLKTKRHAEAKASLKQVVREKKDHIEKLLHDPSLERVRELIDYIQTQTLIRNFELFIDEQIAYVRSRIQRRPVALQSLKDSLSYLVNMSKILFKDGFKEVQRKFDTCGWISDSQPGEEVILTRDVSSGMLDDIVEEVVKDATSFQKTSVKMQVLNEKGELRDYDIPTMNVKESFTAAVSSFEEEQKRGSTSSANTTQDYFGGYKSERAFFFLIDEWNTQKGGIGALNMELTLLMSRHGFTVHCVVVKVNEDEARAASEENVKLWIAKCAYSSDNMNMSLLADPCTWKSVERKEPFVTGFLGSLSHLVLISHAHLTGEYALRAKAQIQTVKPALRVTAALVNHIIPSRVDWLKRDDNPNLAILRANDKENFLLNLASHSDIVLSIGPLMFSHFSSRYSGKNIQHQHYKLTPPPYRRLVENPPISAPSGDTVLFFGRVENVYYVKGVDLFVQAAVQIREKLNRPSYKAASFAIRGVPPDRLDDTLKRLGLGKEGLFDLRPFGTQSDVEQDLRQASVCVMPSRVEPFGLVGLEALCLGVPVIMSEHSGLAQMLIEEVCADELDLQDFVRNNLVVRLPESPEVSECPELVQRTVKVLENQPLFRKQVCRIHDILVGWESKVLDEIVDAFDVTGPNHVLV